MKIRFGTIEGAALAAALLLAGCAHSGGSAEAPKETAKPAATAPAAATTATAVSFEHDIQPALQKYCYACHGNGQKADGLAIDAFKSEADVKAAAPAWNKIKQEIDSKGMPPRQFPTQPTDAERKTVSDWIAKTLAS